jgi:hypothetical protein
VSAKPRAGFQEAVQQMLNGFQTYVPAGFVLPSSSGGFSQATVVAQLQQMLAQYPLVDTAKQAYAQAVKNERAAVPPARALMTALKKALVGYFTEGNIVLAQFGITEKPRAKAGSLQTAVAAAKARQTRQTNGTLGKKQKARIALAKDVQAVASTLVPQGPAVAPQPAKPTIAS